MKIAAINGDIEGTLMMDKLSMLTRLMRLSCEVADASAAIEDGNASMRAFATADEISEVVGLLADALGYEIDEVMAPLWLAAQPSTGEDAHRPV